MSFWDASALVPLIIEDEKWTSYIREFAEKSVEPITVWWGSLIECNSAVSRKHREKKIDKSEVVEAKQNLEQLSRSWVEMEPAEYLRREAIQLLERFNLSAADTLQLAAALYWCAPLPAHQEFICLDKRLREVAGIEGFRLIPEEL